MFTLQEVADRWRVSPQTVRRWVKDGDLRCIKFKGLMRFRPEDVDAFEASLLTGGES